MTSDEDPLAPPPDTPIADLTDKANSPNPLERYAVRRFDRRVLEAVSSCPGLGTRLLDVGCGTGERTATFAAEFPTTQVFGIDFSHPDLRKKWNEYDAPNLHFSAARGEDLPFEDGFFNVVTAIESLEHMPDAHAVMNEIRRVCHGYLIASVPREPLWSRLNYVVGRHRERGGDTPGHHQHWGRRAFKQFLEDYASEVELWSRLPWTIARTRLREL
jgi:SAM-dependent methyltransferase